MTYLRNVIAGGAGDDASTDADEIVVGSHGYRAGTDVLGSVSQELLARWDRPVTIVRPTGGLPAAAT